MKAIILSAGQGRRLLPYTEDRPKCLVPVASRPLIEWQLRSLHACGVSEAVIVTGFMAQTVQDFVHQLYLPGMEVRMLYNPFFQVSDNLASLYLAAGELARGGIILNGDTLFEAAVSQRLLSQAAAPVSVTIDRKAHYDDDDMKVSLDGLSLKAIGKNLDVSLTHGESIGMLYVRPEGADALHAAMTEELRGAEGFRRWYLSAIDLLAKTHPGSVEAVSIEGLQWCEVDCPADLVKAENLMLRLGHQAPSQQAVSA